MAEMVVLGAAESGVGAAVLAKKKGYKVWVSDFGIINNKYKKVLSNNDIEWEEGKHSYDRILNAAEIIKSPGIPNGVEVLRKAAYKGIKIISEIEFAARFTQAKLIGVTGTNGKTTTAHLIYHIFKKAAYDVCLAGNVGKSFAMALSEKDYEYFVLELSSFQLEHIYETRFADAVLLNISPDHLDRYNNDMRNYIDAKFRICKQQKAGDVVVYYADDEILKKEMQRRNIKATKLTYSINYKERNKNTAYLKHNKMYVNYHSDCFDMFIEDFSVKGKHNTLNAMASSIVALRNNIRKEKVKEALLSFTNVPHRLEYVCKVRSAEYYNDSKATNINSTWYALEYFSKPIIWIAGGIDKGNDYAKIKPLIKEKVKAIVCLGLDNSNIVNSFKDDVIKIVETQSMQHAVKAAYGMSNPGDVVLLSPACSSFDLFENFEDRGEQFKRAVVNL